MRKHSVKLLLSINFMLIIAFIVSISQQSNKISILQSQKEHVEKDCNKLYSDYEKLSQEMEECKAVNEEMAKQLDEQKRTVPEGWQPFYGWWMARRYYETEAEREQGYWKEIQIEPNFIKISGKHHLTDEPIYDIAVRIRSDVIEELKSIGIEDESIINMLQDKCYAELDISNTYNWKRELLPGEVDLVENAKYYIIDNLNMLCISQNNGGRLYVLSRIGVND